MERSLLLNHLMPTEKCEDAEEKDVGKSSHLFKSPSHLACAHMPNANEFGHSQASNLSCSVFAGIKVNKFRSSLVAMMLFLRPQMADWILNAARKEGRYSLLPDRNEVYYVEMGLGRYLCWRGR